MTQNQLWHDTFEDALRAILDAAGGPKKVAADLWPSKSLSDAHRRLLHCLDPERDQKLSLDELVWLMAKGREVGCHTAMAYIARACGYADSVPVDPEDERAELQRAFLESVKAQKDILKRMEALARAAAEQ